MFKTKTGRKFVAFMFTITGIFTLQFLGMPLDPMTASGLFAFTSVYVGGQAYLDSKKSKQEQM